MTDLAGEETELFATEVREAFSAEGILLSLANPGAGNERS